MLEAVKQANSIGNLMTIVMLKELLNTKREFLQTLNNLSNKKEKEYKKMTTDDYFKILKSIKSKQKGGNNAH